MFVLHACVDYFYTQSTLENVCLVLAGYLPLTIDDAYLQIRPTMEVISRDVVPLIAFRWNYVGLQLGMVHECLNVIEKEQRGIMEDCCTVMFSKWMQNSSGTGCKKRSWESVLDAVDLGHGNSAKETIMKKLSEVAPEHGCQATNCDHKVTACKCV